MGKIKILKNNKKSKFMINALIIFSFFYALFGVLMWVSPAVVTWKNGIQITPGFGQINTIYGEDYGFIKPFSFLDFILFDETTGRFIFAPTFTSIIYGPLIIGGAIFTIMLIRLIIHSVGYKNQNKNGIARIVRPIRSYQMTMVLAWIGFVILAIGATISFFAASPYQMGVVWEFNVKGSINACSQEVLEQIENGGYFRNKKELYWPTMAWFFDGYIMTAEDKTWLKWIWIFVPTIIFIPLILTAFIGTITGECSWWTINLAVLRDIDATTGTNLATEYDHVEAPSVKKVKKEKEAKVKATKEPKIKPVKGQKQDSFNKLPNNNQLLNFFKSLIKLLEMSKNTEIKLYSYAKSQLNTLQDKKAKFDWDEIYDQAETDLENLTRTDQKFVNLIKNVIDNSRVNVFGRYKDDVVTLIEEYRQAIKEWDVYEAEGIVEQIFTIASRREELLAKVGFCLKDRLANNFKHIEINDNIIAKLNQAKQSEDYDSYRELCLETIAKMSPIKSKISSYADKIIYN
ncbi:hypothetical protein [Spiroplasma culicicola]|uniref:Transmembrane protein n=1 Tax=Spiroplasma culicicola AES-1 TaxID=1276246 RepID=W6A7G1_9MOLU|nr:hypothetical protein [Spiroplasma culicicola]AHI52921.1 hypothetical protein SCULI_v1c05800 [Spiroplasma culicicola AES-1]